MWGVSNMRVARVKVAILGVLFIYSTSDQRRPDAAVVRSDEPGPHIDAISRRGRMYYI